MEIIFAVAVGAFLMYIATKRGNGASEQAQAQEVGAQFQERVQEAPPRENRYASFTAPEKTTAVQSREQVRGRQMTFTASGKITAVGARQYGDGGLPYGGKRGGKVLPWRR